MLHDELVVEVQLCQVEGCIGVVEDEIAALVRKSLEELSQTAFLPHPSFGKQAFAQVPRHMV